MPPNKGANGPQEHQHHPKYEKIWTPSQDFASNSYPKIHLETVWQGATNAPEVLQPGAMEMEGATNSP